jgi:hypothetical protein
VGRLRTTQGGQNPRNSTLKQLQNAFCQSSTFLSSALRSCEFLLFEKIE